MRASVICEIFNSGVGERYGTVIHGGRDEPLFFPRCDSLDEIYFRNNFASSALHEIAHWCIAGAERRKIIDYGYWYKENRTTREQLQFETLEIRPQALEWIFSKAAGIRFHVSLDNFERISEDCFEFRASVRKEAKKLLTLMNKRASLFLSDLVSVSGNKNVFLPETFEEMPR